MVNKKGQELSITTLILIVIGIVVAVIVIMGFSLGWDFVFGKIKLLPGQSLQTVAESCNVAGASGLKIDYCDSFKKIKIDGNTEYVNCQDERVQRDIDAGNKEIVCMVNSQQQTPEQVQCVKLMEEKDYKSRINGVVAGNNNTAGKSALDYCKSVSFPHSSS